MRIASLLSRCVFVRTRTAKVSETVVLNPGPHLCLKVDSNTPLLMIRHLLHPGRCLELQSWVHETDVHNMFMAKEEFFECNRLLGV